MNIKYKIRFYSDWHCGSGLSSGADLDLLVIKDKDGLPFVPGKTIKGLIREVVEEINELSQSGFKNEIEKVFGPDVTAEKSKQENVINSSERVEQGCCFFTNASIEKGLRETIKKTRLQDHLFRTIASTAINENGVADAHSLRKMEVTIPCELEGEILDIPDEYFEKDKTGNIMGIGFGKILEDGLKFIKRIGQNRNRGLGRCSFEIIQPKGGKQ